MKTIYIFILLSLLTLAKASANETDSLLKVLDKCIEQKNTYRNIRLIKADSLKNIVRKKGGSYGLYNKVYACYSHLQADSALYWLEQMDMLDEVKTNPEMQNMVMLGKAEQMAIMGAYYNAMDMVNGMERKNMTKAVKTRYFHVCRTIYGWTASYLSKNQLLSDEMMQITENFLDSILTVETDEVSRNVVISDKLIHNNKYREARNLLVDALKNAKNANRTYCYYNLAMAYEGLHDTNNHLRYLTMAAIEDMRQGVTEYAALPMLVRLLHELSDNKRAYRYLECSMEDANYSSAVLRTIEANEVFPIIEKEHKANEAKKKKTHTLFTSILLLLTMLLIIGAIYLIIEIRKVSQTREKLALANEQLEDANKQLEDTNRLLEKTNRQLEDANWQLGKSNQDLQETNTSLHEMDKVKEEYIAMFLHRCRKYIGSLEAYRRSLLKMAKNGQNAELLRTLKDDSLVEQEEYKFYTDFDEAFLEIHPHFIESFNALLKPEDQIIPKKNELLNPELRIFALIRLGITDTAQIAEFLNYSNTTIYNYRSRIRNKSIYGKEDFEERVKVL